MDIFGTSLFILLIAGIYFAFRINRNNAQNARIIELQKVQIRLLEEIAAKNGVAEDTLLKIRQVTERIDP